MKYIFSYNQPHQHLVDIEFIADNKEGQEIIKLQLPAWRPGRYEPGNFAKNIISWKFTDDKGNPLKSQKLKKDLWQVSAEGAESIHICYTYYAAELNAGST
jgi:predicted metalloprotease with PDZ domain